MSFLSYAQNFEDAMLWRALGHIPNGTYVDVGAQHPRIDSVSRAFYEHGWRGIHVEPVPAFAELLRADRPDETVLQAALGEHPGTLALHVFADTGLSTAVPHYAQRHQTERGYAVERIEVPVLTLASALASLDGKDVHWLKIDVEGFEEQVLRGWDSVRLRPWIMVVEATIPNSPETDFAGWDPILVDAGYRFVWFDGLNRFYIAAEHPELAAAFDRPPNVFDAVELSGQASWGLCRHVIAEKDEQAAQLAAQAAEQAAVRAREQQSETARAEARVAELERDGARLEADCASLRTQVEALNAAAAAASARIAQRDSELAAAQAELRQLPQLRGERDAALAKTAELEHVSYYWWHTADTLTRQLDDIRGSRSWRLSLPLRLASLQARRARNFALRAARWALRQPARVRGAPPGEATAIVEPVLAVMPEAEPAAPRRMSARAARVYADLKQAVEEQNS